MQTFLLPIPILLSMGCNKAAEDSGLVHSDEPSDSGVVDADGDGSPASDDCDDANADVFPGADEVCNGIDDDCDDVVDEDAIDSGTWYVDSDGDGYGAPDQTVTGCDQPSDAVDNGDDCDDDDATRFPGAPEVCGDGLVQDCDGDEDGALAECPPSWPDSAADADVRWSASGGFSYAGQSVAVGDANGDGVDDALVGAWGRDNGDETSGRAYVMLGGAGVQSGELDEQADASFGSEWSWQSCGYAGTFLPDTDGDGNDEVVVHCTDAETGGHVYQFLGGTSGHQIAQDEAVGSVDPSYGADSAFGVSVSGGDVNGDGRGDLLVGAPGWRTEGATFGAALVYLGGLAGDESSASADATVFSSTPDDRLGAGVASVGDTDGDGLDDVLVGAPLRSVDEGCSYCGRVWLLTASQGGSTTIDVDDSSALQISGNGDYDYLGSHLAGAGDVNGDGYADMVLGAPNAVGRETAASGAAYVFLGNLSGGERTVDMADAIVRGTSARGWLGYDVDTAGDVDGDGVDDILVSEPVDHETEDATGGSAYVFLGTQLAGTMEPSAAYLAVSGEAGGDSLGAQVGSGDFDGDGDPDAVFGAPYWDTDEAGNAGAAYLLLNDRGF